MKRSSLIGTRYNDEDNSDHSDEEAKSSPDSEEEPETSQPAEKIEEEELPDAFPSASRPPTKSKIWLSLNSEIEALKNGM